MLLGKITPDGFLEEMRALGFPNLDVIVTRCGMHLGHGCREWTWAELLVQFQDSVQFVRSLGLGLAKTITHYNMFAYSVRSYMV